MRAWETGGDFRAAVTANPSVRQYLQTDQLERAFSFDRQLANIDVIFRRVFGSLDANV